MAIQKFARSDHPGGFIGYRLVVSLGWAHLQKQLFFPLGKGTWDDALAKALDAEVAYTKIAEKIIHEDRIYRKQLGSGPHIVAKGLRSFITPQKRRGRDCLRYGFIVESNKGSHTSKTFNIQQDDIGQAYRAAVNEYASVHGISDNDKAVLLHREPGPELFIKYLAPLNRRSGRSVPQEELINAFKITDGILNPIPRLAKFEAASTRIKKHKYPIHLLATSLFVFYRSTPDKYLYAEYVYSECGGIEQALSLAEDRLVQFKAAEKRRLSAEKQEKGPADYVRYHSAGRRCKARYYVSIPGKPTRRFNFTDDPACADEQLRAYRTALHYAYRAMHNEHFDKDHFKDWRTKELFTPQGWEAAQGSPDPRPHSLTPEQKSQLSRIIDIMRQHDITINDLTG